MTSSNNRSQHLLAVFVALIATSSTLALSSKAQSQEIVGDIFGKLIGPAVKPVLERAAGEVISEGLRRGSKNGGIFPRPRPKPVPSPQPYPQPSPNPVYPPTYLPQPGGTYEKPHNSTESTVTPSSKVPAPDNKIVTRAIAPVNASPLDIALRHVIAAGPKTTDAVVRLESAAITQEMDVSILAFARGQTDLQSLARDYRNASSGSDDTSRSELLGKHDSQIAEHAAATEIRASIQFADAAYILSRMPNSIAHQDKMQAIESMRNHLSSLRGDIVSGEQLAIMAARVKNIRNMTVTSELTRVLGVQRRSDLFQQANQAAIKSRAPNIAIAAQLGLPIGSLMSGVADMDLPPGNPSVVLYNPVNSPGSISFVCDDQLNVALAPGELVPFNQPFILSFKNGSDALRRYTIKKGVFRWVIDEKGWDIREKTSIRFTLDASQSPVPFRYLFNGEPQELAAGMSVEHFSPVPPRLDFDTGTGQNKTKTTLITPGNYVIAVDPEQGTWDIFEKTDPVRVDQTTASIASEHWRQSVLSVTTASSDPIQSHVDSLLNAIE